MALLLFVRCSGKIAMAKIKFGAELLGGASSISYLTSRNVPAFEFRQCTRDTIPSHICPLSDQSYDEVLHAGTESALQIFRLTAGVGVRLL